MTQGSWKKGVGTIAFYDGVSAVANVLEEVSVMPVKYIERLHPDLLISGLHPMHHFIAAHTEIIMQCLIFPV